jgi:acyl carrier protein
MSSTVLDQVRSAAADLFAMPLEAITPQSSPDTIEQWDSMQHLNLMLELEMAFGVKFTPKEQLEMLSIGAAAATVERKLGAVSAGASTLREA